MKHSQPLEHLHARKEKNGEESAGTGRSGLQCTAVRQVETEKNKKHKRDRQRQTSETGKKRPPRQETATEAATDKMRQHTQTAKQETGKDRQ